MAPGTLQHLIRRIEELLETLQRSTAVDAPESNVSTHELAQQLLLLESKISTVRGSLEGQRGAFQDESLAEEASHHVPCLDDTPIDHALPRDRDLTLYPSSTSDDNPQSTRHGSSREMLAEFENEMREGLKNMGISNAVLDFASDDWTRDHLRSAMSDGFYTLSTEKRARILQLIYQCEPPSLEGMYDGGHSVCNSLVEALQDHERCHDVAARVSRVRLYRWFHLQVEEIALRREQERKKKKNSRARTGESRKRGKSAENQALQLIMDLLGPRFQRYANTIENLVKKQGKCLHELCQTGMGDRALFFLPTKPTAHDCMTMSLSECTQEASLLGKELAGSLAQNLTPKEQEFFKDWFEKLRPDLADYQPMDERMRRYLDEQQKALSDFASWDSLMAQASHEGA